MRGQKLQVAYKFAYLGSTLSRVVHIDDEVNARIAKASAAFGRLRGSVWDRSGIRLRTFVRFLLLVLSVFFSSWCLGRAALCDFDTPLTFLLPLLDKNLKVYKAVVLPTQLYACETWTVYQRHAKRLYHFHTSCLRKLFKIKWQDRIPDTEVLKRTGMQSVHTLLKLAQLRRAGHVTRMP